MDAIQFSSLDIATLSAIVAALVTVIGNAFNIKNKYRALLAMAFSVILVFLPSEWKNQIITALVIGLTASGVYSQVKPRTLGKIKSGVSISGEEKTETRSQVTTESNLNKEEENKKNAERKTEQNNTESNTRTNNREQNPRNPRLDSRRKM